MQKEVNFTNKEQVFYNKYIGNFATPKKLNRSSKKVPESIINEIEAGNVTSLIIKTAAQIVPIFTYKTCLTIHGKLPDILVNRIGGYKNVIQNKNGSLEIRYSAIDYRQKKEIKSFLLDSWIAQENSTTGIYFQKIQKTDDKIEAINIINELKKEAELFNVEGLKAKVYVSGYNYFGRYYLTLGVIPLIIEGDSLNIASKMQQVDKSVIIDRVAAKEAEQKAWQEKYEKSTSDREAARKEAESNLISKYYREQIKPIIGAIYAQATVLNTGKAGYRYYKIDNLGSFGRVVLSSYCSSTPDVNIEKFVPFHHSKLTKIKEITIHQTYKVA